jgi:4-hydroxy-3-methylbut-2-enyl diphosphate reductase
VAEQSGIPCFHVESVEELPLDRLQGLQVLGVTAGASTPNTSIQSVVERLRSL